MNVQGETLISFRAGTDRVYLMAKIAPLQFMQQVRSEVSKIVWPSRRELLVTTVMVFAMATLASIFFFLVDQVIRFGLTSLLGFF